MKTKSFIFLIVLIFTIVFSLSAVCADDLQTADSGQVSGDVVVVSENPYTNSGELTYDIPADAKVVGFSGQPKDQTVSVNSGNDSLHLKAGLENSQLVVPPYTVCAIEFWDICREIRPLRWTFAPAIIVTVNMEFFNALSD